MHSRLVPALAAAAATLAACNAGVITGDGIGSDVEGAIIVLEGDDLAAELVGSPVRESADRFVRVGVIWEADRPGAVELSASPDGDTWTAWSPLTVQHVEVEDGLGSFVGQLELEQPMSHYRLRGGDGAVAYVRLELLATTMSESVEDGDDSEVKLSAPIGDADVFTRSEWGARATRCSSSLGSAYRMAIHHTETPTSDTVSPQARLRNIQSYHMDVRGWCDIGYHYLMSRDGRLWEGRPGHLLGAHSGGANTGNVGISVMGSHGTTPITDTQISSVAALIAGVAARHGISINRTAIKGHRQYKPTSCPGNALYAQLDDIVDRARDGGGSDPTPPPPPPPPPGTVTVIGVLYIGSDTSDRIAGATVTLGTASTTTSANGLWTFDGVPSGDYTVTASASGYQTRSITRTTYASETWSSFGLSPAAPDSGTAVLQGVVYHTSDSSNRIGGASISLSTGHTTTADANGFYKLTGLPAGPVAITASASGWTTDSVSRTLADGETAWGSVRLAP
jgi:predicted small secreted protein